MKRSMSRIVLIGLLAALAHEAWAGKQQAPTYTPGLGEIMGLTEKRHAKLWQAVQQQNWPLARYELDELKEGFDDAVKFHPRHKTIPQPLTKIIPAMMDKPLAIIERAIDAKDNALFIQGYDQLTEGCNSCHKASGFAFIIVAKP